MAEALPSYEHNPENIPTYNESLSHPIYPLSRTLSPLSDTSSILSLPYNHQPPAFAPTQTQRTQTLILLPHSTLITPLYPSSPRPLYELTTPLTTNATTIFLAEVPSITTLTPTDHLPTIEKRHHLYKLFESTLGGTKHTSVDGRKRRCMQGTMLRRSADGNALVATNQGDAWGDRGQLIYSAKVNGGVVEWRDAKGRLVARDWMIGGGRREDEEERLEVLVELERRELDMLVAVWVGRIQQDILREEEERRTVGGQVVMRERGLFAGVRGKLGIGRGIRTFANANPPIYA